MCFFSNSGNLLFFSGAGELGSRGGVGWRWEGKKGEVAGLRGMAMRGGSPATAECGTHLDNLKSSPTREGGDGGLDVASRMAEEMAGFIWHSLTKLELVGMDRAQAPRFEWSWSIVPSPMSTPSTQIQQHAAVSSLSASPCNGQPPFHAAVNPEADQPDTSADPTPSRPPSPGRWLKGEEEGGLARLGFKAAGRGDRREGRRRTAQPGARRERKGEKEGEGGLTGDSAGVGEDDGGRRRQAADGGVRGVDEAALDVARPTTMTEWLDDGPSGG
uniref:Uncharacterized protein n=1 Tax=Oryza sativa subsp. japonica TaxID=39947 RepID=Q6K4I1_ORYSJ|nr:hypothetical protein [Oryza sativa Japonica Group]